MYQLPLPTLPRRDNPGQKLKPRRALLRIFLEQEVARLNEERDPLSVSLVNKKDELNELKRKPNAPSAISIPGNPITKSSRDNCHRKGHLSVMNRGNKSCPFTA